MTLLRNLEAVARKVRRRVQLRPRPVVYVGGGRILAKTKYGTRMYLDARDIVITPIIALEGYWEPELGDFIRDFLKPGMTFVDVGANMGYFSCIAAASVGRQGRVFAYEADPEVHAFLVDNLSLNWHTASAVPVNAAAWSEACSLTLHRRGKYKGNTSVAKIDDGALGKWLDTSEEFSVAAAPLHEMLPAGSRPDLVKIDVEGAEPWVLDGAAPLLRGTPGPTLLVEWSPGQIRECGGDPAAVSGFAGRFGYAMSLLERGPSEIGAGDLASVDHGTLVLRPKVS